MTVRYSKHTYELVARVIGATDQLFNTGDADSRAARTVLVALTGAFAAEFHKDNPRFDQNKFADACFKPHKE